MNNSTDERIRHASTFVFHEFNLRIQQSQIRLYSPTQWETFCRVNRFNAAAEGLYVPSSHKAYVRTRTPLLHSNIFHEYFGHGLFCEHSVIGKEITKAQNWQ